MKKKLWLTIATVATAIGLCILTAHAGPSQVRPVGDLAVGRYKVLFRTVEEKSDGTEQARVILFVENDESKKSYWISDPDGVLPIPPRFEVKQGGIRYNVVDRTQTW